MTSLSLPAPGLDLSRTQRKGEAKSEHPREHGAGQYYPKRMLVGHVFRLFKLSPGNDCQLSGDLWSQELKQEGMHAKYDAISYCWGAQFEPSSWTQSITINNVPGFRVSDNLHRALWRLRHATEAQVLWIDAICINQLDLEERGHQVSMMRLIFTQARGVKVWLGEYDADTPTCPRTLPSRPGGKDRNVCTEAGLHALEHGVLNLTLWHLLRSWEAASQANDKGAVWWRRLWVVPEFSYARKLPTVHIDPHSIRWEFFCDLLRDGSANDPLEKFRSMRPIKQRTFIELIKETTEFFCRDPRDRVFALVGLASDWTYDKPKIKVDYNRKDEDLCESVTEQWISGAQSLDVVLDGRSDRRTKDRPTWIPDFGSLRDPNFVRTADKYSAGVVLDGDGAMIQGYGFRKLRSPCLDCRGTEDCKWSMLELKGVHFDHITSIAPVESIAPQPESNCRLGPHFAATLDSLARRLRPQPDLTCSLGTSLVRWPATATQLSSRLPINPSLCIGFLLAEYLREKEDSVIKLFHRYGGQLLAREEEKAQTEQQLYAESSWIHGVAARFNISFSYAAVLDLKVAFGLYGRFLAQAHATQSQWSKVFFSTSNGFLGLGPASIKESDRVFVPLGASRPIIVRHHPGCETAHYELVGDAVIPGIMSGQLVRFCEQGIAPSEWLYLR